MDEVLQRILDCMGPYHGAGKELADYLGISPNVITNWKNGSNKSYRKYLKQISEKYGITVDYLQHGETKEAPTENGERELTFDDFTYAMYEEGKELTEANKAKLLEMAKFFKQQQEKNKG